MAVEKEIIFELNKLILDQTADLSLIAMGLIGFQSLLIAHILHAQGLEFGKSSVAKFLGISVALEALSLVFGYAAKGVLINTMIEYAKTAQWQFDRFAELMSLMQMVCVSGGLLIFVGAFVVYSRAVAKAFTKSP
jgi:hypothetical protein